MGWQKTLGIAFGGACLIALIYLIGAQFWKDPKLTANVIVSGMLTGLVYGLMALGLSVIFGVVRVVNFAHGEMMTIAMYMTIVLFSALKLDPLIMLVPIAAVLFCFGYALQAGFDYAITGPWSFNVDVKKLWLNTDVKANLGGTALKADVDINPWIFGVGLGYRF